jgi:phosphotransferase system enzyme I (PtsI)
MDIGIMVEIPSAALMIESYIDEVDFFSIGTNDLVQYTLAVDRANEKISYLYNHFHPALLQLIRKVIETGKRHKKMVSMCGEMAADPVAVPLLVGMGLENLSAAHYVVPEIKNVIRNIALRDCIRLYNKVQQLSTASEVQQQCQQFYSEIFTHPNHSFSTIDKNLKY